MIAKQAQIEATSSDFDPVSPPTVSSTLVGAVPIANPQQGEFIKNPKSSDPLIQMLQKDNGGVSTSASSSKTDELLKKHRDPEAEVDNPRDKSAEASTVAESGGSGNGINNDKGLGNAAGYKNIVARDGDATQRLIMGMADMSLETRRENPSGGVRVNVSMLGNNKPINHVKIPATQHDNRKLFVGGLPTNVTEQSFLKFFEQFGEVIDSVVMIDRATKRSRGFGFITFAKEEVAVSLLTSIPGKTGTVTIMGKVCEVKASEPKAEGASGYHPHRNGWSTAGTATTTARVPAIVSGAAIQAPPKTKYSQTDYDHRDGRHFDDLHTRTHAVTYSSTDYGRTTAVTSAHHHSVYHPTFPHTNYHHGVTTSHVGHSTSYPYAANAAGWETSYPGPNTGEYGNYNYSSAANASASGLSDHRQYPYGYYAHQGQYVDSSMYHQYNTMGAGSAGGVHPSYVQYSNYYASSGMGVGSSMPPHGVYNSDGSLESYHQNGITGGAYTGGTGDAEDEYDDENYDSNDTGY